MATSLRSGGIKNHFAELRKSPVLISSKGIQFSASVASAAGFLCQRRGDVCTSSALRISCERGAFSVVEKSQTVNQSPNGSGGQLSCVMKFGGSSVASAERMREVVELILSFPEERPVIVLSAMGKTTNMLLQDCR